MWSVVMLSPTLRVTWVEMLSSRGLPTGTFFMLGPYLISTFSDSFEYLMTSENSAENAETKSMVIEDIASLIIGYLIENNMTKAVCGDLEKHAYSVNDMISDPNIRNLNIFSAV